MKSLDRLCDAGADYLRIKRTEIIVGLVVTGVMVAVVLAGCGYIIVTIAATFGL